MREILFRGICTETGEWVKGYYVCLNGKEHRIYSGYAETDCGDYYPDFEQVAPETVGMFTGETDKNDKNIFEGDIISYTMPDGGSAKGIIKCSEYGTGGTCHVGFGVNWYNRHDTGWLRNDIGFWTRFREIEVIGNIHDNPELLEKK